MIDPKDPGTLDIFDGETKPRAARKRRPAGGGLPDHPVRQRADHGLHVVDLIGPASDALMADFIAKYRPGWMLQADMMKDLNRLLVASFLDGLERHGLKCCTLHAGCNCLPGTLNLDVKGPSDV